MGDELELMKLSQFGGNAHNIPDDEEDMSNNMTDEAEPPTVVQVKIEPEDS